MFRILIITLLLALLTGGAVYAADNAAPGDPLCPVDRALENWRAGLTIYSDKAAKLQTQFSAERLDEAEVLLQEDGDDKGNSRFCFDLAGSRHPAGRKLADQYGVAYETIMTWFCQGIAGGKAGYGLGEIMLALETAEKTGVPAEELLAQRGDMGWGEIWQELGLIGKPDGDGDGPPEGKGPSFEVPRGPKEGKGKGKPPDVPPGPPAGRGKTAADSGQPDDVSPGPPFDPGGGPPFPLPGGLR